jgi:uncharacterized Zn-finger protein
MSVKCEFCYKEFSTKGNLIKHQKSTKYCINIQKERGKEIEEYDKYKCIYCDKKFYEKSNYTKHEIICNKKPNKEKEELLNNLEELKLDICEKDKIIYDLKNKVDYLTEEIKIIELKTVLNF